MAGVMETVLAIIGAGMVLAMAIWASAVFFGLSLWLFDIVRGKW